MDLPKVVSHIIVDAVATNTPEALNVEYAKKLVLMASRSAHTSGSSVLSVTGSVDGTIYVTLNLIDLVTNTNAQTLARVASKTFAGNGDALLAVDLDTHPIKFIKVLMTRVTDGTNNVKMLRQE